MAHRPHPLAALAVLLVVLVAAPVLLAGSAGSAPATHRVLPRLSPYRPPVDAPVVDPFRPPTTPYGPGNRGIEYATTPGTPVRAAGAGEVAFAGQVGGTLHVTVAHPDGIRTSYSFLAGVLVHRGQPVAAGQIVGLAGARLHVGARRGERYLDPASLWAATGPVSVHLVPVGGDRSAAPRVTRATRHPA